MSTITAQRLSRDVFAPFGEVIDCAGDPDKLINQGFCGRYHDRATLDFKEGRAGLSLFNAETRTLPYTLEMMERHPEGSQAFIPMTHTGFLITVAPDNEGVPGTPLAFLSAPGQAINFLRSTWHGVLTPLSAPGLFAVIDRIGPGKNLEEHWFKTPYTITAQ